MLMEITHVNFVTFYYIREATNSDDASILLAHTVDLICKYNVLVNIKFK
jgi:hypothetical protein